MEEYDESTMVNRNIRLPQYYINRIQDEYVDTHRFESLSAFVRDCIRERLDPAENERKETERILTLLSRPDVQEKLAEIRKAQSGQS